LEAILRLGWDEVEVTRVTTTDDEAKLLLVHANKQRVKTYADVLNEYEILSEAAAIGRGRRTDLERNSQATI